MQRYLAILFLMLLCRVAYAGERYVIDTDALTISPIAAPAPTTSPTGYEPRVIWSPELQATYARMVAENHPKWRELKATAELAVKGTPVYGDYGQPCSIAYQMTGDTRYAKAGFALVMKLLSSEPNTNACMAYAWEFACCVEWLRPSLSPKEIEEAETQLRRWVELMLGVGEKPYGRGGFGTISDSDRVIGYVLGLQVIGRVLGEDYSERSSDPAVGAPISFATARQAISSKYLPLAEGGVWPPSTMYAHLGLRDAIPAMKAAKGYEEFAALWPQVARAQIAEITADLNENMRWGDNEERNLNNRRLNYRLDVLWCLSAVLGDSQEGRWCRWTADAIEKKYPLLGKPTHRAFWLAGFYGASDEPPQTLSVDSAVGVYLRKAPASSLIATFHPNTGIQHQYERWGDFDLYLNGEHVLDRPLGYSGGYDRQEWGNNVLLCGLGAMHFRESGTGYGFVWGETSGPYYAPHPAYYNPPPSFVRKCRREISTTGTQIRDVIDMDDPRTLPGFARYAAGDYLRMVNADLLAIGFNASSEPVVGDHSVSWKTAGGKTVTLRWADERDVKVTNILPTGNSFGTGPTWRIWTVPNGYKGGPIELVTRVEITN